MPERFRVVCTTQGAIQVLPFTFFTFNCELVTFLYCLTERYITMVQSRLQTKWNVTDAPHLLLYKYRLVLRATLKNNAPQLCNVAQGSMLTETKNKYFLLYHEINATHLFHHP